MGHYSDSQTCYSFSESLENVNSSVCEVFSINIFVFIQWNIGGFPLKAALFPVS